MNEPEDRWTELAAEWRSTRLPHADAEGLRSRVRVKRRRVALAHALDSVAGLLLVGVSGWIGWHTHDPWKQAWAVTVLVLTGVVFAIVTWNRRDLWRQATGSVREHLEWCRHRCRRQLTTIRLAWGIYALTVVADAALLWAHPAPPRGTDVAWILALLALFAAGLAAWSVWYGRGVRAELRRLDRLRRDLDREGA